MQFYLQNSQFEIDLWNSYLYSFSIVHKWGKNDNSKNKEEYKEHQLFGASTKCLYENFESRRVARKLEQSKDSNNGEKFQHICFLQMWCHFLQRHVNVET